MVPRQHAMATGPMFITRPLRTALVALNADFNLRQGSYTVAYGSGVGYSHAIHVQPMRQYSTNNRWLLTGVLFHWHAARFNRPIVAGSRTYKDRVRNHYRRPGVVRVRFRHKVVAM